MSASPTSLALDTFAVAIKTRMATAHAGRLIRLALTNGDDAKAAAREAVDYIERKFGPIDADLMADIARACLAEAEREAAEMEAQKS